MTGLNARGFSLLELALVIAVLGLMASGLLGSLEMRLSRQRVAQTEHTIAAVERALLGFAAAEGARFPCPDADGDGVPDPGPGESHPCRVAEGAVPWAVLGVGRADAWGEALRYRPDRAFTARDGLANRAHTLDGVTVSDAVDGQALTVGIPHGPAAIVFSCGPNRLPDGANAEPGLEPRCQRRDRGSRAYSQGPPGERFDDVLGWVSKNIAISRLIEAGAWPR